MIRTRPSQSFLLCVCLAFLLLPAIRPASAQSGGNDYQKLLDEKAPVLVTVKFLLKIKMGGMGAGMGMGDQEIESEATGVMVDPKGLVLCANSQLEGFTSMMGPMMRAQGLSMTATPTNIKILVGDDEEGVDARLVARDSELDLAWIRIEEPGAYAAIDLTRTATPGVGDTILAVRRMDKYFGRAAVIAEGRVGGRTTRPRELFVRAGGITTMLGGFGLPVYTTDQRLVGIIISQSPGEEDVDPMAFMSGPSSVQDMMSPLILPATTVASATKRAMESVEE